METVDICVIGGGPAGLAAAEAAAKTGASVLLVDQMPTFGRKFLMAGKSGLNLTKDEPFEIFQDHVQGGGALGSALFAFGPLQVRTWAETLGQPVFTGSSGRVFPRAMKASPLLRAWISRLAGAGVSMRTRWRWTGWQGTSPRFETRDGLRVIQAEAVVLALGGASWAKLGSDGTWAGILGGTAPFGPSNMGLNLRWSVPMTRHIGTPVKGVRVSANGQSALGEFVITNFGAEGGAIYWISGVLRFGGLLEIDLLPDLSLKEVTARLKRPRGKASLANHLRKTLRLTGVKAALLREGGALPERVEALAARAKKVQLPTHGPRPLDEAISTVGGVRLADVDQGLMLTQRPGVFCAGEMLDWDAPTGGYLITTCLATGFHAGRAAAVYAGFRDETL